MPADTTSTTPLQELIESDNPGAIFQNAMMQMDDQLVDAVKDIEDQHKGMVKIEQGVREIQELFQDMAVLVDLQQETLDVIERNVQDTAKYTRDAEKNITQAEVYQKNSRKVRCCASLCPPPISLDQLYSPRFVSLSVSVPVLYHPLVAHHLCRYHILSLEMILAHLVMR